MAIHPQSRVFSHDAELIVELRGEIRQKRNILKPILDALKGIVYHDDSQVADCRTRFVPSHEALCSHDGEPDRTFARLFDNDEFLIRIRERQITRLGHPNQRRIRRAATL